MEVIVIVTTKFGVIVTIINIICAYQKKKHYLCACVDFLHYLFSTLSLSSPYDYH